MQKLKLKSDGLQDVFVIPIIIAANLSSVRMTFFFCSTLLRCQEGPGQSALQSAHYNPKSSVRMTITGVDVTKVSSIILLKAYEYIAVSQSRSKSKLWKRLVSTCNNIS